MGVTGVCKVYAFLSRNTSHDMRMSTRQKVSPRGRRDDTPPPMTVRRFAVNQAIVDPEIAANLHPSADGSAVCTSLVAGVGSAAGSQRAYSLGRQLRHGTDRQTDGRIALFQKPP